jgi:hypothetical protein
MHELGPLIAEDLEVGEHIVWIGRPDALKSALLAVPVFLGGIAWTAFSLSFMLLTYEMSSLRGFSDSNVGMILLIIPFVLIGIAMLLSPFWTYCKELRTIYAITDSRILIMQEGKSSTAVSYNASFIGNISCNERPNGSGDLIFAQRVYKSSNGHQRTIDYKFIGIPNVRAVEDILRSTFNE